MVKYLVPNLEFEPAGMRMCWLLFNWKWLMIQENSPFKNTISGTISIFEVSSSCPLLLFMFFLYLTTIMSCRVSLIKCFFIRAFI